MFVGRQKEIQIIEEFADKRNQALLVYGKRRVGKTTLINHALNNKKNFICFECLKDTLIENVKSFVNLCVNKGIVIPEYVSRDSFVSLFQYLNTLDDRFYIVVDEYPYLKELNDSQTIDSHFQSIIDNYLSNINLIISGSQVRMMETVLKEGNPLFGRFNKIIKLRELNYIEAKEFYPSYSIYDSIIMRSIFGGSPFVNQEIDDSLNYEDNIIHTLLDENSMIYQYADKVLLTDVSGELQARRILSYLGNSRKKYKEIQDKLDNKNTGIINRALDSLVELELVRKVQPINKKTDKKKGYYEISDNVLRFYYTYIYQNKNIIQDIGTRNFYNNYIKDTLISFVSLRFEDQVKEYYSLLSRNNIRNDIKEIGTYYYDDPISQTNGQFDVVINCNDGYEICEVKYYKDPLSVDLINHEVDQIFKIKEIKVERISLVNVNGFTNNDLPYKQIDGDAIYKLKY
ncbi:MAG: ATP-binding protein [Erysipelotrichaceae bacterium]|nr:ATP-binding protein [Erysipelotrichaceae bacterium]